MLDRRAMFAHGMPMMTSTNPKEVCHACHQDAAVNHRDHGDIPCPACGERLHYHFRRGARDPDAAIYAHCDRTGCIAILG